MPTGADIKGLGPTAGRILGYPLTVPRQMNDSALVVNKAAHTMVGGLNSLFAAVMTELKPRPFLAKALAPMVLRINDAVPKSAAKGQKNSDVFWGPLGMSVEGLRDATMGWMTVGPLRKAGYPDPANPAAWKAVLNNSKDELPPPRESASGAGGGAQVSSEPDPAAAQGAPPQPQDPGAGA